MTSHPSGLVVVDDVHINDGRVVLEADSSSDIDSDDIDVAELRLKAAAAISRNCCSSISVLLGLPPLEQHMNDETAPMPDVDLLKFVNYVLDRVDRI